MSTRDSEDFNRIFRDEEPNGRRRNEENVEQRTSASFIFDQKSATLKPRRIIRDRSCDDQIDASSIKRLSLATFLAILALLFAVIIAILFGWQIIELRQELDGLKIDSLQKRLFAAFSGSDAEDGSCKLNAAKSLDLASSSRFDPNGVFDANQGDKLVIMKTGFYDARFRAVRVNDNATSCNHTFAAYNANSNPGLQRTFSCPRGTQAGGLVAWEAVFCLPKGASLDVKPADGKSAFKCRQDQTLFLTFELIHETSNCSDWKTN